MAISHNIKPDPGLTRRMLMTGFFLVVLYAVLIGFLFLVLKSLLLILVIAFGLLFCQYYFSDKIASMQARAGAIDELLASGALNDLSTPVDDIQKELDKVTATSQVDNELAALKLELGSGGSGGPSPALPAPEESGNGNGGPAG